MAAFRTTPGAPAMDLKIIEQKQLVERYLLGRLTPPEAKFFEQVVRRSPELAERMGLPEALKRTMRLLDETGTEWREAPPRFWHDVRVPAGLAGALLLAVLLAAFGWLGRHEARTEAISLRAAVDAGSLRAPTRTEVLRVRPARTGEAVPTVMLGSRESPTLAELRVDVAFGRGTLYGATVTRDDGTRWAGIDNLVRDSNGELRVALNSAALAAGTYVVEVAAVNLRGDATPFGRFRVRVDPR